MSAPTEGMFVFTLLILLFAVSVLISVSSLDDAFIDLVAIGIVRHRASGLSTREASIPSTAVFVANWHEEDVLGKMVEGNLARIQIPQVSLYLGVYPNDTGTLRVAKELEAKYPERVQRYRQSSAWTDLEGPDAERDVRAGVQRTTMRPSSSFCTTARTSSIRARSRSMRPTRRSTTSSRPRCSR